MLGKTDWWIVIIDNKTNKQSKSKQGLNTDTIQKKNVKMKSVMKDRKINITQEDLDKLCEVYDWYMNVKFTNKSNSDRRKIFTDLLEIVGITSVNNGSNIKGEQVQWSNI